MTQGTLAPGTQQHSAPRQQLLAYVPPGLAALLTQLATELTVDKQAAAAAGGGGVSYDVVVSALQVSMTPGFRAVATSKHQQVLSQALQAAPTVDIAEQPAPSNTAA